MSYDNRKMIFDIKQKGYLKSPELEKALLDLPREKFVSGALKGFAYKDVPISIGHRQTISQPTTVVIMTEALKVKSTDKILEIGTGSGWQSAILSKLTKKNVYTIERIRSLVNQAKENLKELRIKNVKISEGDLTFNA
ncbi:MAG: protein-L-isoaspartate O-methyltransferase, partial [Nanoarchaeota archaeon]|nr:protein-L-isoaspartate O-methyltransferase [Nanoarchaeota archaeon]